MKMKTTRGRVGDTEVPGSAPQDRLGEPPSYDRHTPGPWTWRGDHDDLVNPEQYERWVASRYDAASCWPFVLQGAAYNDGTEGIRCNNEADARLIAAAPDLLAALRAARRTIRTWHGLGMGAAEAQAWALYEASPEIKRIDAAIAKAEGR